MGGGEQHAGAAAAVLAEHFDVELIGMEEFDRQKFSSVLGRPVLASLPLRIVGLEPTAIAEASSDYDLFINHSYTSEDVSLAPQSLYVVFFPQIYGESGTRRLRRRVHLFAKPGPGIVSVSHDKIQYTEHGELTLKAREAGRLTFTVFGKDSSVTVENDEGSARFDGSGASRYLVAFNFPRGTTHIKVNGAHVSVLVPQLANGQRIALRSKNLPHLDSSPAFVDSYDLVLANSAYTQSWIGTRWSRDSVVHYPPVELRTESTDKERIILSIGRFFDESRGHSKQQLRLVRAFKKLVDEGLEDWKLVLIGGCDKANREYALQVRREAVGYPIEVRLNAEYEVLDRYLAIASIYWHATGFGVDLDRFPDRAEHFGIAPVEAMSTGTIPIVYGIGGPQEIVDYGNSGYFFFTEEDLVQRTLEVIGMPDERRRQMSHAASVSAMRFSSGRFATELLDHVRRLLHT